MTKTTARRLAAGDGVQSAQLVLLLGLLADGAPQSIRAIQDFWPRQLKQPEPTKEKEPLARGVSMSSQAALLADKQ